MKLWKFGLLGHGIGRSLTPGLQVLLGELTGRKVSYPVFDHDESFVPYIGGFLAQLNEAGHIGTNVTHPFKEAVCAHIESDPLVAMLGAANTVCFEANGRPLAHNTDCTGLQAALEPFRPANGFGAVALLGAGGFGKAAAFALAALGASEIRMFDPTPGQALGLANRLREHTDARPVVCDSVDLLCDGATGIANCSPIGMHHHPGNPVTLQQMQTATWVFDAVYIPMKTEFLQMAEGAGITAVSGAELVFWQAVHAFQYFTNSIVEPGLIDAARLRFWPEVIRRSAAGE
jgi:shikimate dehydrogenase